VNNLISHQKEKNDEKTLKWKKKIVVARPTTDSRRSNLPGPPEQGKSGRTSKCLKSGRTSK
jgi:hypothetical protein